MPKELILIALFGGRFLYKYDRCAFLGKTKESPRHDAVVILFLKFFYLVVLDCLNIVSITLWLELHYWLNDVEAET